MSYHSFLIYNAFIISMFASPGPNTAVAMAVAMNRGLRAAMPHCIAVAVGSPLMLLAAAFGLGEFLNANPFWRELLRYGGSAYLFWLAWRVAGFGNPFKKKIRKEELVKDILPHAKQNENASSAHTDDADKPAEHVKPLSFMQALGFQLMNPKVWLAHFMSVGTFLTPDDTFTVRLCIMASCVCVVGFLSTALWGAIGAYIGQFFLAEGIRRCNYFFALLLVLSVVMLFV